MNTLLTALANIDLPDYQGLDKFKELGTNGIANDTTWLKTMLDYASNYIVGGLGNMFHNFGLWIVETGHTLSYWLCTIGGMYCTEKYAMTRDRTCINKFSKLFLIYLFLTLLCTLL